MASGEKGVENGRIKESKGEQQPGRVSLARLHHRVQAPFATQAAFSCQANIGEAKMSPSGAVSLKVFLLVKLPRGRSLGEITALLFYLLFFVLILIRRDGAP